VSDEVVTVADDLQYCPRCGAPLIVRLLPTEDRPRLVCDRGHILYVNPKLIVGVIPERQRQILLMRRGIEPRYGFWTYPGGYMEIDESVEECAVREGQDDPAEDLIATALREAEEEIGVKVEIRGLVGVYSRPGPHGPGIVSIVFRGETMDEKATPGREALEARWFEAEDIPWDDLAYDTTRWALRDWTEARGGG